MCVILALSWRDVCMVVAWDSLATWFEFGGTVFEKLMFAYVFTSTYSYPDLSRCVQNCSNAPPPRSEWSERSSFVWFTYYVLITYFLLTYYLHNTHFFTYLSLTYYSALTHTYQDVSKTAPEMRPRSERSERSTFVLRTYYVLMTYLSLSLLLARYARGTCFALAWCLHGSCAAFSIHVCVCLYVCHVFSMCLRVSSNFHLIALPVPWSVRFWLRWCGAGSFFGQKV